MSVLSLFTEINDGGIGVAIRASYWLFPFIEAFHLLALCVIGGVVLVVNMRMLGVGLRQQPVAEIARDARPFLVGSLAVMLISGYLLFTSEAVKCYNNPAFWFKMSCLLAAMLFTFTVQNRAIEREEKQGASLSGKLIAVVSLLLWTGVGIGGRWIGFS
jgi:uncharacterized membrane protein YhdT